MPTEAGFCACTVAQPSATAAKTNEGTRARRPRRGDDMFDLPYLQATPAIDLSPTLIEKRGGPLTNTYAVGELHGDVRHRRQCAPRLRPARQRGAGIPCAASRHARCGRCPRARGA